MITILYIFAPLIYMLIIIFSVWFGIRVNVRFRSRDLRTIFAILAGFIFCPLAAVLDQLGHLEIPAVEMLLPLICLILGVGFIIGLSYVWVAALNDITSVSKNLFVMGSIGGSVICLYFYFFHSQLQGILIGSALGFLFGALIYAAITGIERIFHFEKSPRRENKAQWELP